MPPDGVKDPVRLRLTAMVAVPAGVNAPPSDAVRFRSRSSLIAYSEMGEKPSIYLRQV